MSQKAAAVDLDGVPAQFGLGKGGESWVRKGVTK